MKSDLLDQASLHRLLNYDAESGQFTWRVDVARNVKAGATAGTVRVDGYAEIGIGGKRYFAHRLAWLYVYGEWPKDQVDHINCVKSDNRIVNLRNATRSQNMANRKPFSKAGRAKGVTFQAWVGKWRANIWRDGRMQHLGNFATEAEAAAAYAEAAQETFGAYARTK